MVGWSRLGRIAPVVLSVAMGVAGLAACEPLTAANSITVNRFFDGSDADPDDGVCEVTPGEGDCSLRAAVDEANHDEAIIYISVPKWSITLSYSWSDDDDNATGDLDVAPASGQPLTFLAPRGTVLDADQSESAIDVRSGFVFLNGISATRAAGPGYVARSGATLWVFGASPHFNGGPGVRFEAGSQGQVRNTTVSDNGGGIDNAGTATVALSTITANDGAGISGAGTTTVTGSIVANQTSGHDCAAPVSSAGWNAFGDAGCGVAADDTLNPALVLTPEVVDDVPGFVPGPAEVQVRDSIPNGAGPCQPGIASLDQHLTPRPIGLRCDKGALETPATSTDIVVNTAADAPDADPSDGVCDDGTGACTLRAAVAEANERGGTDPVVITIVPGVDPVLAPHVGPGAIPEPLTIDRSTTIDGDGATIEMSGREEVFVVEQGAATFRDLNLTGSDSTFGFIHSGSSAAARSLTLDHVTTTANTFNGIEFYRRRHDDRGLDHQRDRADRPAHRRRRPPHRALDHPVQQGRHVRRRRSGGDP